MVSVLNTVETGHEDIIHDAEMDYYGQRLATCSSDQTVKVYNLKNGTQTLVADLKGHYGPVWQIAWAHPKFGNFLASCSYDRKVIIWKETSEWSKFYEYTNHDSSVNSVCWAPHEFGLILACGSLDGTISILTYVSETNTWEPKRILNAHTSGCNAVSWCPATALIASLNPSANRSQQVKRLVSGGCDNLVKIWKEEGDEWKEESKIEVHSDWVRDVAWAPSVGLTKNVIASCSQDHSVVISTSDDFIHWNTVILKKFEDVVWSVSWSLTANILAVSGADNKVSLWKTDTEGHWACISEVIKGQGEIAN